VLQESQLHIKLKQLLITALSSPTVSGNGKAVFLLPCLLLLSTAALGLGPDTTFASTQDPAYVRSFREQPHLTFEFARRRQKIDIRNPNLDTFLLRYEANTRSNFIATFDYKWLSLSLGLFSFGTTDSDRKGNSTQFSIRGSYNGKRLWNSNFYQSYKGFYLTNPQVAYPLWNPKTDLYPQRPDVKTTTFFSNLYYCFTPDKFSYRAALWQLDRQEKSAGSFLAGAAMRFYSLNSDSGITMIPKSVQGLFDAQFRIIAQRVSNFSLNIGYVHTFVYDKSWFLTLYFVPGLSLQNGYYQPEGLQIRSDRSKVTGTTEFRIIAGYNGDKWYGGLSSYSISFAGSRDIGTWVDNNYNWFRLFVGFRLDAPEGERRFKILEKIGL
jgi:hypothetical protein